MSFESENFEDKFNIICIKWGQVYTADYVNRLYSMVRMNTTVDISFYCFTEISKGLDPNIIVKPLPVMNIAPEDNRFAYRKEAGLCDDDLGGLRGQRVVFFDLDVVIVDNIDDLFTFPKRDDFVIINDWNTKGNHVGQASCYSWRVGTLGHVKKYFEDHPKEIVAKFHTASQEYLSSQVIKTRGALKFWPEPWFRSFKVHCLPKGVLRHFIAPIIPEGAKVIAFHGSPKPHEAIAGVWSYEEQVPFYKRWYKAVQPTPWVEKYWK